MNTYADHAFSIDTSTNVAGLTALKESASDGADTITVTGAALLTIESDLVALSIHGNTHVEAGASVTVGAANGALLTVARARSYLLLTGNTQDVMLGELIAGVEALMTGVIGSALIAAEVVEEVYVGPRQRVLHCRNHPIASVASVVDPFGGAWDVDAFLIRGRDLRPYTASGGVTYATELFGASGASGGRLSDIPALLEGTWVVTYTGGLDRRSDWELVVKPSLAMAALQEVSDWYNIRTARSTAQREGDMSHSLEAEGVLSKRCMDACLRYSFRGM